MKTQRTALLLALLLLGLAALGSSATTAQTELFFATGVDSTGWAQAQSNADGHVLIESPQYPRGLWLHLVDEAGDALAGLGVEYQGRPDSLVAIHCVDPAGEMQETLVWTRPSGGPLRLALKSRGTADLPAGLAAIDWQINLSAESLLVPEEEARLNGWEAVAAFLQERWQGQTGRAAVQLNASTLAVEVDHPETVETLVAHLRQMQQPADAPLGEISPLKMQVFAGSLGLREGVILLYASLFDASNLEEAVRQTLSRPQGRLTLEEVTSLTVLQAERKAIRSLVGIEYFVALQWLDLYNNRIVDLTPLNQLKNLTHLSLIGNQIADITPLADLNNLDWLWLSGNQITDLTPLNQLTNLIQLDLSGNQIADLTPLNQLDSLGYLGLSNNQIVDLTPLNQLKNLIQLRLSNNQIADLTPLNQLKNLISLGLSGNQIVDLTPLNQLTNLQELKLNNNPLSAQARNKQIPILEAKGVNVTY